MGHDVPILQLRAVESGVVIQILPQGGSFHSDAGKQALGPRPRKNLRVHLGVRLSGGRASHRALRLYLLRLLLVHGDRHPRSTAYGKRRDRAGLRGCGNFGGCDRLGTPAEEVGRQQQVQILLRQVQGLLGTSPPDPLNAPFAPEQVLSDQAPIPAGGGSTL